MVGDVPKGAPMRCRLGRHTGQESGGTLVFTCPRCGGSYWQPDDPLLRSATAKADALIADGRGDEAVELARQAVRMISRWR